MRCSVLIAIISAAFAANAAAGEMATNEIKLFQFQPKEMTVKAGTTVAWTNGDDIEHSVTAKDGAAFDSGFFKKGGRFEFTFAAPGTYEYFCKRHPSMKASVTVTE